jgi:hypothetical protein
MLCESGEVMGDGKLAVLLRHAVAVMQQSYNFLLVRICRLLRPYSFVLVVGYENVIMSLYYSPMCRWRSSIFGMEYLICVAFISGSKSQRDPWVGRLAGKLVRLMGVVSSGIESK